VPTVHPGPLVGLAAQVAALAVLVPVAGVGIPGALVGLAYGVVVTALLLSGLRRSGAAGLGPADRITLARSVLVGGVAALVGQSLAGPGPAAAVVVLAVSAIALDGVDGRVARRTGTVSALGARFDMEVDAALVLLLAVVAAGAHGAEVVALGLPHYGMTLARWAMPWLRRPAPPRYWCKVVAVVQVVGLLVLAAGVVPDGLVVPLLLVVAVLLAESFGRETWELWRTRGEVVRSRARPAWLRTTTTVLAVLLVWFVLVLPDRLVRFVPEALLRIPIEGLVLVLLVLVLPRRLRRPVAVLAGALFGLLVVVRVLDVGFREALHRPFNPVTDWRLLDSAAIVLRDTIGNGWADVVLIGAAVLAVAVPVLVTLATVRVCRVAAAHRTGAARSVGALGVLWLVSALLGAYLVPNAPIASLGAAQLAVTQVETAQANIRDLSVFRAELAAPDPWADVPGADLLTGLRGKDVVLVFVESYGRVAVEGSTFAAGVRSVLDDGTRQLQDAGFDSRSAFLTSPTFGGVSWLAHATLHSGLWIDSQQRHDQLFDTHRFTLASAFGRAGWRTVADIPSNRDPWPEGEAFYGYDRIYDRTDVGYAGPKFSFAAMPDQYTMAAFERLELGPGHSPVMAEIDLVSSHEPWTPLPRLLDWSDVGDGSVYDGMPAEGSTPDEVFGDAARIQALYGQSIQYSLQTLVSWITTFHRDDDDLVVVLVGDHQPAEVVTGPDASHDVPITVVARDPAVLDRIAPWGWDGGMLPGPDAPVQRMDAFRDRFLTAFGTSPAGG
jgi:phosphatidylglycerophosphate synthase